MSSLFLRNWLLFSFLAVWLLVLPGTARAEGDIRISITGISQDGTEISGEGATIYTVQEVPTVHPGDDRTLGTLRVTVKPGYENLVWQGARVRVSLPPGTCYMTEPTKQNYRNYVIWPATVEGRKNRIADSESVPGLKFVAGTPHSLTVEVGNVVAEGQTLSFDFVFNCEGFSAVRVSSLVESAPEIMADPEGYVTRLEFLKWLGDVTLPFASCPLVLGELSDSRYRAFNDLDLLRWESMPQVRLLLEAGLVKGYPGGKLGAEQRITRAEAASLIGRVFPEPGAGTGCFKDSLPTWAASDICRARKRGIIAGYPDGSFRPDQVLTRSEALIILQKTLESYAVK